MRERESLLEPGQYTLCLDFTRRVLLGGKKNKSMLAYTEAPCLMFVVRRRRLSKFITLINGVHVYIHTSFNEEGTDLPHIYIEIEILFMATINIGIKWIGKKNLVKVQPFKVKASPVVNWRLI